MPELDGGGYRHVTVRQLLTMPTAVGWLEDYRKFWEASLDRLEDYLAELQKGNPDGSRN